MQDSQREFEGTNLAEALDRAAERLGIPEPDLDYEILEQGRYGPLAPVGDAEALGDAILSVLDQPPEHDALRRRANDFTVDHAVDQYEALLRRS